MFVARFILALLCSAALVGCETASEPESSTADPSEIDLQAAVGYGRGLVGSWRATSIMEGEEEMLRGTGVSLVLTFDDDGGYLVAVSGDEDAEFCEVGPSCTLTGDYRYTSYILTLEDDGGPDSGYYVLWGNKLIFFPDEVQGETEGAKFEFVLTRR